MKTDFDLMLESLRNVLYFIAGALIVIFMAVIWCVESHAGEFYVASDLYHNQFSGPAIDGTWKQDRIPDNGRGLSGSESDLSSLAYDVGLGYRFTPGEHWYSQGWSLESGWRRMGTASASGRWVTDDHYRQTRNHGYEWLEKHGVKPAYMAVVDRVEAGYLRTMKGFDVGYGIEPYLSVGFFVGHHTVNNQRTGKEFHAGMIAGPTVGGGIKYDLYKGTKLRIGAESHWTFFESGHPISSSWVLAGGGIEVPLSLGGGTVRDYLWQR